MFQIEIFPIQRKKKSILNAIHHEINKINKKKLASIKNDIGQYNTYKPCHDLKLPVRR